MNNYDDDDDDDTIFEMYVTNVVHHVLVCKYNMHNIVHDNVTNLVLKLQNGTITHH